MLVRHITEPGLLRLVYAVIFMPVTMLFSPAMVHAADVYAAIAPAYVRLDVGDSDFRHAGAAVQLGANFRAHNVELSYFAATSEDTLHFLQSEVASSVSALYRYDFSPVKDFKIFFLIGASDTEVELTSAGGTVSESYSGTSYGFGFEEALDSDRNIKIKLDLLRLYGGDTIDIDVLQVGVRYVF